MCKMMKMRNGGANVPFVFTDPYQYPKLLLQHMHTASVLSCDYILKVDMYMNFCFCSLTDVNECEVYRLDQGGKLCLHECVNVPGSYRCSCPSGYKLLPDGRSCEGEWQGAAEHKGSFRRALAAGLTGHAAPERNTCELKRLEKSLVAAELLVCAEVSVQTLATASISTPQANRAFASGINDLTVSLQRESLGYEAFVGD